MHTLPPDVEDFQFQKGIDNEQQRLALLDSHHRQWLQHPATVHYLKVLEKGIELAIKSLGTNSRVPTATEIESQKQVAVILSVQLNTLQTYKNIATDTETFKKAKY